MHIHVAEGVVDADAGARLEGLAQPDWLLAHGVHLDRPLPGTLAHNPRSNMNNSVGYANPAAWPGRVVLGSDGIGADMLEEFRLAYARSREADMANQPPRLGAGPAGGNWCRRPSRIASGGRTTEWTTRWRLAFTPGIRAQDVWVGESRSSALPNPPESTRMR